MAPEAGSRKGFAPRPARGKKQDRIQRGYGLALWCRKRGVERGSPPARQEAKIKTASKEDTVSLYGAGSGESKGVRPPPGKRQKARPHPKRIRPCFMVPEAGVEPAPCRQDRILSYLLHTEYKRTQTPMEVVNGHLKARNY